MLEQRWDAEMMQSVSILQAASTIAEAGLLAPTISWWRIVCFAAHNTRLPDAASTAVTVTRPNENGPTNAQVTLASLAARLNDTREVSRVMTYTALAAETEVIENLREVLDGLQVGGEGRARREEAQGASKVPGCNAK